MVPRNSWHLETQESLGSGKGTVRRLRFTFMLQLALRLSGAPKELLRREPRYHHKVNPHLRK